MIERRELTLQDGRILTVIVNVETRTVLCVDPDTCVDPNCSILSHDAWKEPS